MSGRWEGFTEEDIKLMTGKEGPVAGKNNHKRPVKLKAIEGNRQVSRKLVTDNSKVGAVEEIPNEAKLSKPKVSPESCENSVFNQAKIENNGEIIVANEEPKSPNPEMPEGSPSVNTVFLKIKNNVAYEVLEKEKKTVAISDFQFRQKMMEEQNRKRKELLAQAISERKKKTRAEAHRLQEIQEELQKLDNLLSNDVSILRNQIEAACLDFSEAQKRYDKAEKEFLDAKLVLFTKMEKKELLTGHLCTIIEQNELRKAKKLSELMEKLQLSSLNPDVNECTGIPWQSLVGTSEEIMCSGTGVIKDTRFKNVSKESHQIESTNGDAEEEELQKDHQVSYSEAENAVPSDSNLAK